MTIKIRGLQYKISPSPPPFTLSIVKEDGEQIINTFITYKQALSVAWKHSEKELDI